MTPLKFKLLLSTTLIPVFIVLMIFLTNKKPSDSLKIVLIVLFFIIFLFATQDYYMATSMIFILAAITLAIEDGVVNACMALFQTKEKTDRIIFKWEIAMSYAISQGDRKNIQRVFNQAQRQIIALDKTRLRDFYHMVYRHDIIKTRWLR